MRFPRLIVVVLAVLLAAAQAAAAATPQPRIVGGVDAAPGAWPAQASVRINTGSGTANCGGTLVSARWVLTAGHCVTDAANNVYGESAFQQVRIGSISRTAGGVEATVDEVVRHPSFSESGDGIPNFDLALLHLAEKVPAPPLPMIRSDPAQASFWSPGTMATVVGWGYTRPTGSQSNSELQQAQVPIVSDASCAQPGDWGSNFDASTMVCAGRLGIDTCSGDSGGPLMVPRLGVFTLVGVTSWGSFPCAEAGVSGVYVRLGAPAVNGWVRSRVPSIAFTTSPAAPAVGEPVTFTAAPGPAGGTPSVVWDTDGDNVFDDGAGPSVTTVFPTAGTRTVAALADYPVPADDRAAIVRDAVTVTVEPPPPPPPPPASTPPASTPPPPPAATATAAATPAAAPAATPAPAALPPFAAKLEILRATVLRAERRLSVLAPITARASGEVRAAFHAAGRIERFDATIDADNRRVRINRAISRAQANLGTGILTLTYGGDSDTQPQEVRLRAASRRAGLEAARPRISNGRLIASGEISRRARGVVRLQLLFEPSGEETRTIEYTAPISNGRYRLDEALPGDVRAAIAQRRGVVHSYTLFTGYFPARIRGEMSSFQVLGNR